MTSTALEGQYYEDIWRETDSGKMLCPPLKPLNRNTYDSKEQTRQVES